MINHKIIKVCGMRNAENIQQTETLPIDMMGFIFYPKSPRFLYEIPAYLPKQVLRVGVFVNENKNTIEMYADRFELNYIQLHGNESPEYCKTMQTGGFKIIKAFSILNAKDLQSIELYEPYCDYFLFDTKCDQYGGSGNQFDWSILNLYQGNTPFLLSGGINQYSSRALKEFSHPLLAGYDLNSRFETKPGEKDVQRIDYFLKDLQNQESNK